MNLISKILKIKKEIENDPTLTSLIRNGTIEYIAQSAERGYENFSIFAIIQMRRRGHLIRIIWSY